MEGSTPLPDPMIDQLLDDARLAHAHLAVDVEYLAVAPGCSLGHAPDGLPFLISSDKRWPAEPPIWFAALDGRLYVFSEGQAGKVKRLRNSSRARVAVCDLRGRLRGEWIEAVARVVDDPETIERAFAALRAKYGWQMWIPDLFSRLAGRIHRRAIIEIEV